MVVNTQSDAKVKAQMMAIKFKRHMTKMGECKYYHQIIQVTVVLLIFSYKNLVNQPSLLINWSIWSRYSENIFTEAKFQNLNIGIAYSRVKVNKNIKLYKSDSYISDQDIFTSRFH